MDLRLLRSFVRTAMITTRAVPALLSAHHRRVAISPVIAQSDFADPLGLGGLRSASGCPDRAAALDPHSCPVS
jgi:hypothetical protein